ncbi:MAG: DEAD/DEAH box helicase [Synechococcales bacterium]|nr:DEAD/DEAH box helicase [Synechococcales bacterium]
MAILHGNWLVQPQTSPQSSDVNQPGDGTPAPSGCFFVWGEVWRRIDPLPHAEATVPAHPFAMKLEELGEFGRSLQASHSLHWPDGSKPWRSLPVGLPTYALRHPDQPDTVAYLPQHSAAALGEDIQLNSGEASEEFGQNGQEDQGSTLDCRLWEIPGWVLMPEEAIAFLQSLPLNISDTQDSFLGGDLRFWCHVARWNLDLLARAKFLPLLERQPEGQAQTRWQALVDSSADQARLAQFTNQMPVLCQTSQPGVSEQTLTPLDSRQILTDFLNQTLDAQVRTVAAANPLPATSLPRDIPLREWLQALGHPPKVTADAELLERLESVLSTWLAPLQRQLSQELSPYRTCFTLEPPPAGEKSWALRYGLQALDDPDYVVSAETVWAHPVEQLVDGRRTIPQPQETLLAGLGLASRLYPVLDESLQEQQPTRCSLHPLQTYEFIKSTAWQLQDNGFGVILPPSLSSRDGWASRLGLAIRAQTPRQKKNQSLGLQSLLNFKWELTIGGQRISREEFDRLVAQDTPLVEINGEWVELRSQDIKAAQNFFASRKDQLSLSLEDALRISTGDTQVIEKLPVVNFEATGALQNLIETLTTGNQTVDNIPVPAGFRGELRPYQLRGVSWLKFLVQWGLGACLADDMGLGKTIQLIALLLHLKETEALDKPTLLVCPTSVVGNWEREARRFAPDLRVRVHHGEGRSQGKAFAKEAAQADLVITSYGLAQRDEKTLKGVEWQGVVLDEAQNIKNPDAKQSKAVRELESDFRIALTGTPVENRLSELWSIIDFLNPGYLGPRNFFQRRFAVPIERYGDTDSLQALRLLVQPFILRRLKTDRTIIQDLPLKQEMTIFCGLSEAQAEIYQQMVDESLAAIESSEGIQRRGMILALLTRLKQVCNHPVLVDSGNGKAPKGQLATSPVFKALSGKLQRLEEMLDELLAEGDRALIFTQFAEWGKQMKTYLETQFGREVLFLYGSTSKNQREAMVDRFQNDPQGPRIFILSLKAGGVGLNLTRANHVFHFDRWWNPAVENQATDRAFRIGQTRNVQVHKFVCSGTLEERIHELIESKKALSDQVVGTGENWLTDFDSDQLRNLLLLDRTAVIGDD